MNHFELRGGGGTAFRPAFEYVEPALRPEKKFSNLRGLLYFTDGMGTCPAPPPGLRHRLSVPWATNSTTPMFRHGP